MTLNGREIITGGSIIIPMALYAAWRLYYIKEKISTKVFSRKDYLSFHKDISPATASRDLLFGIEREVIKKQGEKIRFYIGL